MRRFILPILFLLLSCEEPTIDGCTTSTACNYNAEASKDDGNCISPQGCNNWCEGDSLSVQELDCVDVCGGEAVIDDCSVCNGIDGYVAGTCYDCAGDANGTAIEDCLGVCGGDATLTECEALGDLASLQDIINLNNLYPSAAPFYEPTEIGEQNWEDGRLISLDLSSWSLDTLPSSIANFTALTNLNLKSNNISVLPNTISNLTSLTTLDLRYNNLTTLPNTICDIYNSLATIQLSSNYICPSYPECITDENLYYQNQDDCESMGCIDATACNVDATAFYSYLNDTCWYANEGCDCSYPQYSNADCDGVCNGDAINQIYWEDNDSDGLGGSNSEYYCSTQVPDGWVLNDDDADDNCYSHSYDCAGECDGNHIDDDGDGVCDEFWGTVTDIDGNTYKTIQIGEQVWMAENLMVTHYSNGDNISTDEYYDDYYSFYAANDDKEICPAGFYIPTRFDYIELNSFLGSNAGGKMKEAGTTHWASPNTGATNESGFTALPKGKIQYIWSSSVNYENSKAGYWTASYYEPTDMGSIALLYHDDSELTLNLFSTLSNGWNIRCIKDE